VRTLASLKKSNSRINSKESKLEEKRLKEKSFRHSGELPNDRFGLSKSTQRDSRNLSGQVVDFSQRVSRDPAVISEEVRRKIARQEQENGRVSTERQEAQRVRTCTREAIANILVASLFGGLAAGALSSFLPQYSSQKQSLAQLTANVKNLELKVEDLRDRFPMMFDAGKSKESNFRRNGWFKQNQVPIKQEVRQQEAP
jgi:cell division protein FtsB